MNHAVVPLEETPPVVLVMVRVGVVGGVVSTLTVVVIEVVLPTLSVPVRVYW
ncbi:MAG TPA: hypothetical protein VEH52_01855 [Gaiellaceae bacterium]|nr:hypothetical protein [Gaiellaceae bacterium]